MKYNFQMYLFMSVVLLIIMRTDSHAWLFYYKPAIEGKVVDAETKLPIEGATVVVTYRYNWAYGFESVSKVFDVRECVTDNSGRYYIPSKITFINPLSLEGLVRIIYYKPGYKGYQSWYKENIEVMELIPLKTIEERLDAVSSLDFPLDYKCPNIRNTINIIRREYIELGKNSWKNWRIDCK